MTKSIRWIGFCLSLALSQTLQAQPMCSYQTYTWNTIQRKAVDYRRVEKAYSEVTLEEIDPDTGCSLCEQDQRVIDVPPLKPFRVCRVLAAPLENLLRELIGRGEAIHSVVGYRVGKTRGEADANGLRTRFSNHSFGVAIDINTDSNGLYSNCFQFGPQCRLIRGGPWDPAQPSSLHRGDGIVSAFEALGLKWGGEIQGRQKDFMHFSPSGY